MRRPPLLFAILLVPLVAAALWVIGWTAPAILGALWGVAPARMRGRGGTGSAMLTAALAALLGWLLALVVVEFAADAWVMAGTIGGVMGMPGLAFYLLGPLLGALLGGSAAALTYTARSWGSRGERTGASSDASPAAIIPQVPRRLTYPLSEQSFNAANLEAATAARGGGTR